MHGSDLIPSLGHRQLASFIRWLARHGQVDLAEDAAYVLDNIDDYQGEVAAFLVEAA